ncbi:hypothetical protein ACFOW4_06415 [Micromonospora sp. GCM10011542]|uniref:hypothetical protein n=1 Tax=Micromonospora sp. GCM10011542 TaxID=3317337 RepID=UPI00360DCB3E
MITLATTLRFLAVFALTLPVLLGVLRDEGTSAWPLALTIAVVLGVAFASIGGRKADR